MAMSPQRTHATPCGQRIDSNSSLHFSSDPNLSNNEMRLMSFMAQTPKKRKLPRNIGEKTDREIMVRLFGKRAMAELDKVAERDPKSSKDDSIPTS